MAVCLLVLNSGESHANRAARATHNVAACCQVSSGGAG